jgi:hypothetical protein
MALTASALTPLVYADYVAALPTATAANRENVALGIGYHNVPYELVDAISKGFVTALLSMTVFDAYTGTTGGSAATPTPPVFNPGVITTATASFLASMVWTGTSSGLISTVLISSFFNHIATLTQIQMNVLAGAGPGAGSVNSGVNPSLSTAMSSACAAAIIGEITSTSYFNQGDIIGGAPTAQITTLATNLSTAYGTVVGSVTAAIPYVGSPSTPTTAPLTVTNSGKFL